MNNDGQTGIDYRDEWKVEKFKAFHPAGPTASGGFRQDPLITFYSERMVYPNGHELYATQRCVSVMDVVEIKGLSEAKRKLILAQTRAARHESEPDRPKKTRRRKDIVRKKVRRKAGLAK